MSLVIRNSPIQGIGMFTTEPIGKHSVVCRVNIIREITEEEPLDPDKGELLHHCHWFPDGRMVLIGEPHCFTNQSCDPNVFYYTINKVSYFMAMREIAEGDELTLDYSLCNFGKEGGEDFECTCGSPSCRGRHRFGFRFMDGPRQMRYLPYLDPCIVEAHADLIQGFLEQQVAYRQ
jgi:SET domain-containing protein